MEKEITSKAKIETKKKAPSDATVAKAKKVAVEAAGRYHEAVGRRKTSIARVRLFTKGEPKIVVNGKDVADYFFSKELLSVAQESLSKMNSLGTFVISVKVLGGGIHSQAEAVRHGISRALIEMNGEFRTKLKKAGFLTRDPRAKERRKFGLKKARKAPQWNKR